MTASTPLSPTAAALWRRVRGAVLVTAVILAGALLTVLLTGGQRPGSPLDPADTGLDGSRALAGLLRAQGVTVRRVTTVDEALLLAHPGSQVLIPASFRLSREHAQRLRGLQADRLLIGPNPYLDLLAPGVQVTANARPRSREPECDLPAAARAGSAYQGGAVLTVPPGGTGCYPAGDGALLVRGTDGERTVTVVGDGAFLSNRRLAEDGNAALAVNLTGLRPVLVWLTPPRPGDPGYREGGELAGPDGQAPAELLPGWVPWLAVQLALATALAALWRGRRLGPVVAERLPVVVRAAETAEGHGRLYRARRARGRAAAALRAACLERIRPWLGLPGDARPDEIITVVAGRTGWDVAQVHALLYGPAPHDDTGLVSLADRLDVLERQVRGW